MEAEKGLWKFLVCLDTDSDKIWDHCMEYESKEEAIEAGIVEYNNYCTSFMDSSEGVPSHLVLLVGEIIGVTPDVAVSFVTAEDIFDQISENMRDEYGEVASDYLDDVKEEHDSILEQRLKEVVKQWMVEFGYSPQFALVQNTEKVLPLDGGTEKV